jgi:hypothetical protein
MVRANALRMVVLHESMKLAHCILIACCEVVIPALVSRGTEFSKTDRLGIRTNVPHREWIHRQSFQLGRHLLPSSQPR